MRFARSRYARVSVGRLAASAVFKSTDRSPLAACKSGASALTSTTSEVPPTSSVSTPTVTRSPPLTTTPARLSALKPVIETSNV
jgi:hypothetical protein